jgi:hypothetical protein
MYQGAKWILLKQKKRSRKSHAWAPLTCDFKQDFIPPPCIRQGCVDRCLDFCSNKGNSVFMFLSGTDKFCLPSHVLFLLCVPFCISLFALPCTSQVLQPKPFPSDSKYACSVTLVLHKAQGYALFGRYLPHRHLFRFRISCVNMPEEAASSRWQIS